MLNKLKIQNKGFTLIELVLVIAIIGIFALGALIAINPRVQSQKANDARRKSDLSTIAKGLESYYQDNGSYPASTAVTYLLNPGTQVAWGGTWAPYVNNMPEDPIANQKYVYYSLNNGQSYVLYASLERGDKDSSACTGETGCPNLETYGISRLTCGGVCNFAVHSTDISP